MIVGAAVCRDLEGTDGDCDSVGVREKIVGHRELEYKRLIGVPRRRIEGGLSRGRVVQGNRSSASLSPCVGQRVVGIGVAASSTVKRNLDERVDGLGWASIRDGPYIVLEQRPYLVAASRRR